MDTWLRVANSTIAEYIRQEEVNILRSRKLLSLLQSKGRITFGHSGTHLDWKVRYKRVPITGYADGDTLSYPRHEHRKTAQLEWRGYSATDSYTKFERLQNRSTEAIVKAIAEIATFLKEDIQDNFGEELYVDGNATGNNKKIHGLESFFSTSGPVSAAVPVELNNDTYAGLLTAPGAYGGSWTTSGGNSTWPLGTGDAHYDFWTPLVTNASNPNFSAATDSWRNNVIECLRFGLVHTRAKNQSPRGNVELILLDNELYRVFLEVNDSRQQIRITRGDKIGMVALGFEDVVNFDGVDVTSEYGIPPNVGYGIATEAMELCSMQDQLFVPDSDTDISTKATRFSIDFFGNLKCNPRNFVKYKAV